MELVSAAKMRKAIQAVLASRPYALAARRLVKKIAAKLPVEKTHPLLRNSGALKKILLIAVSSDKGLCGGFNAQILRTAKNFLTEKRAMGAEIDLIAVGKRGASFFKNQPVNIVGMYTNLSNNPLTKDIWPITKFATDGFLKQTYDKVFVAYTDFKSALVQKPAIVQLLPFGSETSQDLGSVGDGKVEAAPEIEAEYVFEPDLEKLLDCIVPRLVEVSMYQAILESNASEHSSRMMNMKNATSAASDMIDDLTFTMNQVRQATITREISEISAGKAALQR
jgi:F-type H+-transporting ATPase subunit gamma